MSHNDRRLRRPQGAIDVHAHTVDLAAAREMRRVAPHVAPEFEEQEGIWYASFPSGKRRSVETGLVDLQVRLADMDRLGVQFQALANWTSLYLYDALGPVAAELVAIQNDGFLRTAKENPQRFVAMAGLPMQAPELAVSEIQRIGYRPEFVGVQIGTNVNGSNLDDEALEPVWQSLEDMSLAVLVHPWGSSPDASERLSKYHLKNIIGNPLETAIAIACLVFSGVMERHPNLRFGFVHGGGFMPYQVGRWDRAHGLGLTKIRLDAPPSHYISQCYFDLLTHSPQSLAFLAERFGTEKIVVGTDYPWDMGTSDPFGDLTAANLGQEVEHQVGWQNAVQFLRWPFE